MASMESKPGMLSSAEKFLDRLLPAHKSQATKLSPGTAVLEGNIPLQ